MITILTCCLFISQIQPHFLQRLKKTTFKNKLPTKKELVVWTHLSSKQRSMYEDYLEYGETVQMVLSGETKSPLQAIAYLKKVCGHPALIRSQTDIINNVFHHTDRSAEELIEDSAKLQALVALVNHLIEFEHRILIFSQSTKMLDIIEKVFQQIKMGRIDGTTKERDRQYIVDKFNQDESKITIMLLSTKAAGLGLTLTGADRAIIFDPSWNPADDSQAVDRCYRIGQTKKVTVYRLISAGTVEERMYEKQVFKDGIRRTILTNGGDATERHFDKAELRRIFKLDPIGHCDMIGKLGRHSGPETSSILESIKCVLGVTSHDLVYTREEVAVGMNESILPFSTTPLRSTGRLKNILCIDCSDDETESFNKENIFSNKIYEENDDDGFIPLGRDRWNKNTNVNSKSLTSQHHDDSSNNYKTQTLFQHENSKQNITLATIEKCLAKVDELLKRDDHIEKCMEVLLDILESENLDKKIKLKVHKNIANAANRLEWL